MLSVVLKARQWPLEEEACGGQAGGAACERLARSLPCTQSLHSPRHAGD